MVRFIDMSYNRRLCKAGGASYRLSNLVFRNVPKENYWARTRHVRGPLALPV